VTAPGSAGSPKAGARRAVRASRTVVRPERRDGGTTLVFKLARPAVLRFTIVRVYPSCERVGSFVVRGRRGVNRVPFRGRVRGKPLPDGTYRLRIRPKGARADVAVVTVVIVNGRRLSSAEVRRARRADVCRAAEIATGGVAGDDAAAAGNDQRSDGGGILERARARIGKTADAFSANLGKLPGRLGVTPDDPLSSPFVLIVIGLLTLSTAALGTLLLAQLVRSGETQDRPAR
jgi:hypothetical protein